jgi:AcrR family transcriptional regulator
VTIRVTRKPANAYQHGNLREALVNAGLRLLNEGGVANLSLRAAAELAGVSHAAPYRHFKDKVSLLAAIAEQGFRLLTAAMQAEVGRVGTGGATQRLSAIGRGYLRFATEHPGYLGVIFGGVLSHENKTPELDAAGREAYLVLRNTVSDGITSGEFRPGDPDLVSLAAWSLVHGLSHLINNHAVDAPKTAAALATMTDNIIGLLGEGIVAEARPPAPK